MLHCTLREFVSLGKGTSLHPAYVQHTLLQENLWLEFMPLGNNKSWTALLLSCICIAYLTASARESPIHPHPCNIRKQPNEFFNSGILYGKASYFFDFQFWFSYLPDTSSCCFLPPLLFHLHMHKINVTLVCVHRNCLTVHLNWSLVGLGKKIETKVGK